MLPNPEIYLIRDLLSLRILAFDFPLKFSLINLTEKTRRVDLHFLSKHRPSENISRQTSTV
jgi:hypothetical protein